LGFAFIAALARALRVRWPLSMPQLSVVLWMPGLWLGFGELTMKLYAPLTHAFIDDWGIHLKWIGVFAAGLVFAGRADFWSWCLTHRAKLAGTALAALAMQTGLRAWSMQAGADPTIDAILWSLSSGIYGWSAICALCGFAARYLDQPSEALSHLNEAILPIYILHQPVLCITAWHVFPLKLPVWVEGGILLASALLGSLAIYEMFVRPWGLVRPLFGLKARAASVPN
jgi:hypothetical protein